MTRQGPIAGGATLTFQVHFQPGRTRHRRLTPGPVQPDPGPRGQVPRLTRVLALAHAFQAMIRAGTVKDYAELARLTGFSRARITHMMDLTLLAPDIQEQILTWPRVERESDAPSEKQVRTISAITEWERQRRGWAPLISEGSGLVGLARGCSRA